VAVREADPRRRPRRARDLLILQLVYSGQISHGDETAALPRTAEAAVWWIAAVVKEAGFITVVRFRQMERRRARDARPGPQERARQRALRVGARCVELWRACPVSILLSSASCENAKFTETVAVAFVSVKLSFP
jgi:hypothetical protein